MLRREFPWLRRAHTPAEDHAVDKEPCVGYFAAVSMQCKSLVFLLKVKAIADASSMQDTSIECITFR